MNRALVQRPVEWVDVVGPNIILEYGKERTWGCCCLDDRFLPHKELLHRSTSDPDEGERTRSHLVMVYSELREYEVRYTIVAIDTSGKWWRGDSPTDIEEYLRAYTSETYRITHDRACKPARSLTEHADVGFMGGDEWDCCRVASGRWRSQSGE